MYTSYIHMTSYFFVSSSTRSCVSKTERERVRAIICIHMHSMYAHTNKCAYQKMDATNNLSYFFLRIKMDRDSNQCKMRVNGIRGSMPRQMCGSLPIRGSMLRQTCWSGLSTSVCVCVCVCVCTYVCT